MLWVGAGDQSARRAKKPNGGEGQHHWPEGGAAISRVLSEKSSATSKVIYQAGGCESMTKKRGERKKKCDEFRDPLPGRVQAGGRAYGLSNRIQKKKKTEED